VNVLAVDPGGTTGVSCRLGDKVFTCVCTNPSQLWELIVPELDEVVYERFASSVATSHFALYTVELCGSLQSLVWSLNKYAGAHIVLARHEPQNRIAFLKEAKELVHAQREAEGKPYDKTIVHEIDATAHRLARESLGDDVRRRNYGKGISNA
jgi:hypothetical protein